MERSYLDVHHTEEPLTILRIALKQKAREESVGSERERDIGGFREVESCEYKLDADQSDAVWKHLVKICSLCPFGPRERHHQKIC